MSNEVIGHTVAFVQFVILFTYVYITFRNAKKRDEQKRPIQFMTLALYLLGLVVLTFIPEFVAKEYFPNFAPSVKDGGTVGILGGMLWNTYSKFLKK